METKLTVMMRTKKRRKMLRNKMQHERVLDRKSNLMPYNFDSLNKGFVGNDVDLSLTRSK